MNSLNTQGKQDKKAVSEFQSFTRNSNFTTHLLNDSFKDLFNWCTDLTGEQAGLQENCIITEQITEVILLLRNKSGIVVEITAPRGGGKTTALQIINNELLEESKRTLWSGTDNFLTEVQKTYCSHMPEPIAITVLNLFILVIQKCGHEVVIKALNKMFGENSDAIVLLDNARRYGKQILEDKDAKRTIIEAQQEVIDTLFRLVTAQTRKELLLETLTKNCKTIIIDLPDYDIKNRSQYNRDLKEIQELWRESLASSDRTEGEELPFNIVFSKQEELSVENFFEGKAVQIRLNPIPTEALISTVKSFSQPFDDESLSLLAFLSGGNFRRFKEFIRKCLLKAIILQRTAIAKEDVNTWIDIHDKVQSLDLQLTEIWPASREKRVLAVKVIEYIKANKEISQTSLVNQFFIDDATNHSNAKVRCARFLLKLEEHNYIVCRKEGSNQFWRSN